MGGLTGVFGGTFDPPHDAHYALAETGRHELGLDEVFWVVTAKPPHKPSQPLTPIEDRVAMVKRMVQGREGHVLSRADIDRPGPHYALGTMRWLHEHHPGRRWVYLMGEDSLSLLGGWHRASEFVASCDGLGVMERPGIDVDWTALERAIPGLHAKVRFFNVEVMDLSSHDLRRRVHAGESIREAVPSEVAAYIQQHSLYSD